MTRLGFNSLLAGLLIVVSGQTLCNAAATNEMPDFTEMYDLVRSNSGLSAAELNRAAVQGLLATLGSRVSLGTENATAEVPAGSPIIAKAILFEGGIAYVRVARVGDGVARELNAVYQRMDATNQLTGFVLDLRYATGTDYAAAAAVADLFVGKARPLLNWGNGVVSAQAKTNAIELPVAVLVNRETAGAAEALAAVLRSTGAGLILGNRTAGRALISKSFPLKTGGELRIASAPVTLGNGAALSADGLKPDIDVVVNAEDERAYYADAFYVAQKTNLLAGMAGSLTNQPSGTNGQRRFRLNEAELVREHREGLERSPGEITRVPAVPELETPVVSDPTLARALDLLKGLAVVRQSRA